MVLRARRGQREFALVTISLPASPGGQTLIVTVAEVGDTEEASLVAIEIRDAANVVRASTPRRNLVLGRPVILSTTLPAGPSRDVGCDRRSCTDDDRRPRPPVNQFLNVFKSARYCGRTTVSMT